MNGVLVTGSHRSGSTWLGRLLASAPELHYVQEPFNIVATQRWLQPRPSHQFLHLDDDNLDRYRGGVEQVLRLRYPLRSHLARRPRFAEARRMARIAADARVAARRGARPLVKDPIAVFSTARLRDEFGLRPVVIVRSPVAFVGSLVERDWDFDFRHWAEQDSLMREVVRDLADEVRDQAERPRPIVDQGILMWTVIYRHVLDLARADGDLIVVNYEDLASDPIAEIPPLFERLDLTLGPAQQAAIEQMTTGGRGSSAIDVHRNSRAALRQGTERLGATEADLVTRATSDLYAEVVSLPG